MIKLMLFNEHGQPLVTKSAMIVYVYEGTHYSSVDAIKRKLLETKLTGLRSELLDHLTSVHADFATEVIFSAIINNAEIVINILNITPESLSTTPE